MEFKYCRRVSWYFKSESKKRERARGKRGKPNFIIKSY
jgi:hypothetical protein